MGDGSVSSMGALLTFKEIEPTFSETEKRSAIADLLKQGVFKTHIEEYVPTVRRLFT